MSEVRIGIVGCGVAARAHLPRLVGAGAKIVGCVDADPGLADRFATGSNPAIPIFGDHLDLIRQGSPTALAIFTPHLFHYRPALDALQAGCHVFVEKPLSTTVQEASDLVGVARARNLKVGVGHQFRLLPALREARRLVSEGSIGPVRMVVATLARRWLPTHEGAENHWRFDPKVAAGGILADDGDHLLDALIWSLGGPAAEVAAFQTRLASGLDLVTAAALRMADGILATLAISGQAAGPHFEIAFHGEQGRLVASTDRLIRDAGGDDPEVLPLPAPIDSIDGNFVAAIRGEVPLCCPAEEALDTVRLLEAIARSAATAQVVRLG